MVLRHLRSTRPFTQVWVPLSTMLKITPNPMRTTVCISRIFVIAAHLCFFHCALPEPDTVEPSVSNKDSNSSLLVSWNPPLGRVERYSVFLNSSFPQDFQNKTVANNSYSHEFKNLSSGRLYSVQIMVQSGPKTAASRVVFNATCKFGYFL